MFCSPVDAIWSYMVTDYTYDELGQGRDLDLPSIMTSDSNNDDSFVGRWGEELVDRYLQKQRNLGNILSYEWMNDGDEKGLPYDFVVRFSDQDNSVHTDFVEVKSTKYNEKSVFEISVQQIKFAEEMRDNFHIFRVFSAGDMEKVRLIRIYDLNTRLTQKQVKLCMLI